MALTNRQIDENVDTVFLTTTAQHMYLSSSIVREVAMFGGNIEDFVPKQIVQNIKEKYQYESKGE